MLSSITIRSLIEKYTPTFEFSDHTIRIDELLKTAVEHKNGLKISDFGPMGITLVDGEEPICSIGSKGACLGDIFDVPIDIATFHEDPLPADLTKPFNTSEKIVLDMILTQFLPRRAFVAGSDISNDLPRGFVCDGCAFADFGELYTICNQCDFLLCNECQDKSTIQYFIAYENEKKEWYRCIRCECLETF